MGVLLGTSTSSSPQPQHSHLVIQQLLGHLDANSRSAATVRAGIVEVLSEAAVIAATGSVGKAALGGVGAGTPPGRRTALGWRLPPPRTPPSRKGRGILGRGQGWGSGERKPWWGCRAGKNGGGRP